MSVPASNQGGDLDHLSSFLTKTVELPTFASTFDDGPKEVEKVHIIRLSQLGDKPTIQNHQGHWRLAFKNNNAGRGTEIEQQQ